MLHLAIVGLCPLFPTDFALSDCYMAVAFFICPSYFSLPTLAISLGVPIYAALHLESGGRICVPVPHRGQRAERDCSLKTTAPGGLDHTIYDISAANSSLHGTQKNSRNGTAHRSAMAAKSNICPTLPVSLVIVLLCEHSFCNSIVSATLQN